MKQMNDKRVKSDLKKGNIPKLSTQRSRSEMKSVSRRNEISKGRPVK